jgi:hypothetical protein
MNKIVAACILITVSTTVSAQIENQKVSLPDTSSFLFDLKPASPLNNNLNFNTLINPFPTKLAIEHKDFYITANDPAEQDSLGEQKVNPDLLFVRSAYFTGKSPLEFKKRSFDSFTDSEWGEMLSLQISKAYNEKYGNKSKMPLKASIGIGIPTKEERMKARAEKRKRAYIY